MIKLIKNLYFANAGDSRSVLCKNGVAEAKSEDHKPEMDSEKTRIYKADGWISDGRVKGNLNLTRGFGDLEYKQNKKLKPEDQMITANPDIWNWFSFSYYFYYWIHFFIYDNSFFIFNFII